MEGRGSYKQRNREPGIEVMRGVNLITQFCFAMEIQGWARLILDHRDELQGMEGKGQFLTSRDVSLLVLDSLRDQSVGRNVSAACFHLGALF